MDSIKNIAKTSNGAFPYGYYCKRMWIPFVLLDVASIRKTIAEGISFMTTRFYNDFPWNQRVSRLIYKYRLKFGLKLKRNFFRKSICDYRPDINICDTGANIYEFFVSRQGVFIGTNYIISPLYIAYYNGLSRSVISSDRTAIRYSEI